jgi:hypothetical protein
MITPADMTDLFPAFSLGGVALIGLMARLDPPPRVRWSVVGGLALLLVLYLTGQIRLYLPDRIGLPVYIALLVISGAIIWWNWRSARAARRN